MANRSVNEKLITEIKQSGKSLYAISRESGLPYTTIHRLFAGKLNINQCAFDTVNILSAYLGCSMEDITNPTQLMQNVAGKYRGIPYHWVLDDSGVRLQITDHGQEKTLLQSADYTQRRFRKGYVAMTECAIDVYCKEKEGAEHAGLLSDAQGHSMRISCH